MQRPSWPKTLAAAVLIPAAAIFAPRLLRGARPATRFLLERAQGRSSGSEPVTPGSLASELWGEDETSSHSAGAQRVRAAARELFPREAPGQGGEWRFSAAQVLKLKAHLDLEEK
jgi:hypothetical protein